MKTEFLIHLSQHFFCNAWSSEKTLTPDQWRYIIGAYKTVRRITTMESLREMFDEVALGENHMEVNWRDHIVTTPEVLRGKPRIQGTRIPVSLILGYLAADYSFDGIMEEFPDLKRDDIVACLDYARDLSDIFAIFG